MMKTYLIRNIPVMKKLSVVPYYIKKKDAYQDEQRFQALYNTQLI